MPISEAFTTLDQLKNQAIIKGYRHDLLDKIGGYKQMLREYPYKREAYNSMGATYAILRENLERNKKKVEILSAILARRSIYQNAYDELLKEAPQGYQSAITALAKRHTYYERVSAAEPKPPVAEYAEPELKAKPADEGLSIKLHNISDEDDPSHTPPAIHQVPKVQTGCFCFAKELIHRFFKHHDTNHDNPTSPLI